MAKSGGQKRFVFFTSVQSSPGAHPPFPKMGVGVVSHLATGLSMSRAFFLLAPLYLRDILLGDVYLYSDFTVVVYTGHITHPVKNTEKTSALRLDMATQNLVSIIN